MKLIIVRSVGAVLALFVAPIAMSVRTMVPIFDVSCWLFGLVALLGGCVIAFRTTVENGKLRLL